MSVYTPILDDGINVMGSGPEPQPDPAPMIISITPDSGDIAGGYDIRVAVTNLTEPFTISIDGVDIPEWSMTTPGTIIVTVPPGTEPGPVDVTVTTEGGTDTKPFTYEEPEPDPPTVLTVSPDEGSIVGGSPSWNPYTVTITGEGFGEPVAGVSVTFGGKIALGIETWTDTEITGVIPPTGDALGPVDVSVNPAGGPAGTLEDGFTYIEAPPMVTLVSAEPASGPLTGGTEVTLTGTGFSHNLQEIKIGNNGDPWDFTVISDTEVIATSAARSQPVSAQFFITTAGGQNTSTGVSFTYLPVPIITGVSPSTGLTTGGEVVDVTGSNLGVGGLMITFGGAEVTSLSVNPEGTIATVTTPAASEPGQVEVEVTTNGGSASLPEGFTYEEPEPDPEA